jgi:hypothetical protein
MSIQKLGTSDVHVNLRMQPWRCAHCCDTLIARSHVRRGGHEFRTLPYELIWHFDNRIFSSSLAPTVHCYCPVIKCHQSSARHTISHHVMPHPANLKALPRSFSNHDSRFVILSAAIELCEAHSSPWQTACETKRYIPVLLHCRSTPRSVSRLGGPCHCDAIMIVKTSICLSVHLSLGLEV